MKNLKKKISLLRRKGGFTLVEVVVALGVFSIFALLLCVTFSVVFRMTAMVNTVDKNLDTQIGKIEMSGTDKANEAAYTLNFADGTDAITTNGTYIAKDSTGDRIHLRIFAE